MSLASRLFDESKNVVSPIKSDPNAKTQRIKLPTKKSEAPTGRLPIQSPASNNVSANNTNPEYSGDNSPHAVINKWGELPNDSDRVKKPTHKELSDIIHGRNDEKEEDMNPFKYSLKKFSTLAENSPLAPVAGFNRNYRHMSPEVRSMVLQSRMPDIMAFAEDRQINPGVLAGVAEASMRLGRIPDLGTYGISGDDAFAVMDFIKDSVLNLAESIENDETRMLEDNEANPKAKHLKLASDYKKLAEFHKRRTKEEMDKGKIAKEDGRAHSSIRALSASEEHKTLAAHCMGLADYHQLKANEHPAEDGPKPEYPAQEPKGAPAEPPQDTDSVNEKAPKSQHESTTEANFGFAGGMLGTKTRAFPERASTIIPMIERAPIKCPFDKKYARNGVDRDLQNTSGEDYKKDLDADEAERTEDKVKAVESVNYGNLDSILMEAKKKKTAAKKKAAPKNMKKVMANAETAPLFHDLGHKMDHAESKVENKKPTPKWAKALHSKCLSSGGGEAADLVLRHSLSNDWVRDQGFTDESANLRRKWETAMSDDTQNKALETPMAPTPIISAVDKILKMAGK